MSDKQVRAQYTREYKLEAVRQVKGGQSIAATAKVLSRHAYLKALLAGRAIDKPAPVEYAPDHVEPAVVRKPDPGIQSLAQLNKAESEKLAIVRAELEALDEASMAQLLGALRQNFVERQMPAAAMKRLEEGKWQSGLIMGDLARFYWKRTRGTEWGAAEVLPQVERIEQGALF